MEVCASDDGSSKTTIVGKSASVTEQWYQSHTRTLWYLVVEKFSKHVVVHMRIQVHDHMKTLFAKHSPGGANAMHAKTAVACSNHELHPSNLITPARNMTTMI